MYDCNIAERMSWASTRKPTRPEDMAYCLFEIFNVNMPPLYGEGVYKAFRRLQEEIMKNSMDLSILAWSHRYHASCLAPTPKWFRGTKRIIHKEDDIEADLGHFTITNKGLLITLPIIDDSLPSPSGSPRLSLLSCTAILPNCQFAGVDETDPQTYVGIRVQEYNPETMDLRPRKRIGIWCRAPMDSAAGETYTVDKSALNTAKWTKMYLQC